MILPGLKNLDGNQTRIMMVTRLGSCEVYSTLAFKKFNLIQIKVKSDQISFIFSRIEDKPFKKYSHAGSIWTLKQR